MGKKQNSSERATGGVRAVNATQQLTIFKPPTKSVCIDDLGARSPPVVLCGSLQVTLFVSWERHSAIKYLSIFSPV